MSENSSQPSPISESPWGDNDDLTADLDLGFDGAEDILRTWRRGIRPDPDLTVSEWADQHRWLSSRASAEPGRYRTARTPYLREIMDALSPRHPAQRISFMKAAQVGATEAGNNWIGFVIHHAPGPMLAVLPTVEMAKRTSRGRLDPLIADSPALRERVQPARSRDAGNSMLSKEFPGGILVLTGANSATGLRSMPARYIFLDEVDAYPASADEEGDPVTLAEARTTTFSHRRKVFMVSTPTIRGLSRIEREFEASDQRRYFVPCPHCGAMQWLQFDRLRWAKGHPETAAYACEGCEKPIAEHHKTQMLQQGEWRATATSVDPHSIGFHISALYSPLGWKSWVQIARDWLAAQGSDEMLRAARNTLLGETWVESGDAPEWQRLADRREVFAATVPHLGLFLTAGADVQKDRIEVDIWAWGRGLESWLVEHIVIAGGPEDPGAWDKLTALLGRTWAHESGAVMQLSKLAIDTGYEAPAVYAWSRAAGYARVTPIKGVESFNCSTPVSGPTFVDATIGGKRLRRGARLWTIAVSTFKAETYRFLRLERPSDEDRALGVCDAPGTMHLPTWADTELLKQLVAEQMVTVGVLVADFYAGPVSRFDLGNALVADLFSGTLESVTDITLLGGANALAVETGPGQWEIVQAGSAELIAAGRYRLTRLLRGLRGTENAVASVVPTGARVVVLDQAVAPLPISEADLGLPWNWRIGPASRPVGDETYVATAFTPEGAGLRPFSVAHVEQPWRTARSPGDLTIRWTRRSRALAADTWGVGDVPLAEVSEAYEVEIRNGVTVILMFSAVPAA